MEIKALNIIIAKTLSGGSSNRANCQIVSEELSGESGSRSVPPSSSTYRTVDKLSYTKTNGQWTLAMVLKNSGSVQTSVEPIHFLVLCNFRPSCSEPCTSNPRVHAASTIFCKRDMLGIAVRDGPCVPHAEYIASL